MKDLLRRHLQEKDIPPAQIVCWVQRLVEIAHRGNLKASLEVFLEEEEPILEKRNAWKKEILGWIREGLRQEIAVMNKALTRLRDRDASIRQLLEVAEIIEVLEQRRHQAR
jgi:hypothetical protein